MEKKYKLPREFGEKWVKALRSGEYKQGQSYLKGENGYCCLGIACSIQGVKDDKLWGKNYPKDIISISPICVPDILLYQPNTMNFIGIVATLNDDGNSFLFIADWIERNATFI